MLRFVLLVVPRGCSESCVALPQVLKLAFCARLGSGAALLTPGFCALRELDLSWCSALRSESLELVGCVTRPPPAAAVALESVQCELDILGCTMLRPRPRSALCA